MTANKSGKYTMFQAGNVIKNKVISIAVQSSQVYCVALYILSTVF